MFFNNTVNILLTLGDNITLLYNVFLVCASLYCVAYIGVLCCALRSWYCYVSVSDVGIVMYCTALHCTLLYSVVLYCIVLMYCILF